MKKQALKAPSTSELIDSDALQRHLERVAAARQLNVANKVVANTVQEVGSAPLLSPERRMELMRNLMAQDEQLRDARRALQKERKMEALKRSLKFRRIPNTLLGLGLLGGTAGAVYGAYRLNQALGGKIEPPPPPPAPIERNKFMSALYRIFNVEPNLPEMSVPKAAHDLPSLAQSWSDGFVKRCDELGVDAEDLVALVSEKDAAPSIPPVVPKSVADINQLLMKLQERMWRLRMKTMGGRISPKIEKLIAEGRYDFTFPPRKPQIRD